ncbi:MAG: TetR/AcrR family transcriptional regulator [Solirubrobacteraceae bacterium]|nr:TetR/AcrR family transcriptional regulator [Solirubrobacteraceae bacterium]
MAGLADAIREKGLAKTQITDIVRHARASRTTFYRSFPDKESCFFALAERLNEATMIDVAAAVDPDATWETQIDQAIDAYLRILSEDPEMVVTFVSDLPLLGEQAAQLHRAGVERYAELVVQLASSPSMKAAGVRVSMEQAVLLMAGIDGLVVRSVARGEPVTDLAPVAKDALKRVFAPTR